MKNRTHPAMERVLDDLRLMTGNGSQKITFGEMRSAGVRQVLIYCADYRCGHFIRVDDCADRWPDDLRLTDIEDSFVCTICGKRGADIRPDWHSAEQIF